MATRTERSRPQMRGEAIPCMSCMGAGTDTLAPARVTRSDAPKRAVLALVRPCPDCEGRGLILSGVDRDLMRSPLFSRSTLATT